MFIQACPVFYLDTCCQVHGLEPIHTSGVGKTIEHQFNIGDMTLGYPRNEVKTPRCTQALMSKLQMWYDHRPVLGCSRKCPVSLDNKIHGQAQLAQPS